jgi:hypothetical protein
MRMQRETELYTPRSGSAEARETRKRRIAHLAAGDLQPKIPEREIFEGRAVARFMRPRPLPVHGLLQRLGS